MTVFLVVACGGEWDEAWETVLCACLSKTRADEIVDLHDRFVECYPRIQDVLVDPASNWYETLQAKFPPTPVISSTEHSGQIIAEVWDVWNAEADKIREAAEPEWVARAEDIIANMFSSELAIINMLAEIKQVLPEVYREVLYASDMQPPSSYFVREVQLIK